MKYIITLFCCLFYTNVCYCQDWVNHIYVPPVVEVQQVPSYSISTYTTYIYRPMTYQWVPHIVNEPILIERNGLFCQKTTIVYKPTIRWVYQLTYLK